MTFSFCHNHHDLFVWIRLSRDLLSDNIVLFSAVAVQLFPAGKSSFVFVVQSRSLPTHTTGVPPTDQFRSRNNSITNKAKKDETKCKLAFEIIRKVVCISCTIP